MARQSVFEKLYHEALAKLRDFERVRDNASAQTIMTCALTVINRHGLHREFADELVKSFDRPQPFSGLPPEQQPLSGSAQCAK